MARSRVFFDGAIRWEEEALISPLSTGLLYGDGIYEVLRSYQGTPFRFGDHYAQLSRSCEALRLRLIYDEDNLWLIVRELLRQNDLSEHDGYIRITVFGAEINQLLSASGVTTHTFAHARRFVPPKPAKYKKGVKARISSYRISPYSPTAGHCTICYLPMILARRAAWDHGLDEVFVQSTEGGIAEGSTSNLFIVKDGRITTPPAEEGIQLSVTRGVVLELAKALGIPAVEKSVTRKALLDADEVFIANSLIQIMPVREVDDAIIGTGSAGPVSSRLLAAYQEMVIAECAPVKTS
jgi:branched-chain amino acid aminotransferase